MALVLGFIVAKRRKAEFHRMSQQLKDLSTAVAELKRLVAEPAPA